MDAVLRQLEALPAAPTGGAGAAPAWALPGIGVALLLAGRHREAAGAGRTLLDLGRTLALPNARCWGHVLLGAVRYEWNHLPEAAQHLAAALEARDGVRLMPLREGTFGLALALQAQGRAGEADGVLDRLTDALLRTANAGELARVGAFRVRLALLRGELAPARAWLPTSGRLPAHWLDALVDSPPLTRAWARLCLAPEAPSPAAARAAVLADVDALLAETERLHLVTRQVQALALRAVAQHALGATAPALASLERALDLAEPGGLVRSFLDLGPPLVALLRLVVAGRPGLGLPAGGARRRRRAGRPGPLAAPAGAAGRARGAGARAAGGAAHGPGARGARPPPPALAQQGDRRRPGRVDGDGEDPHGEPLRQAGRGRPPGGRAPGRGAGPPAAGLSAAARPSAPPDPVGSARPGRGRAAGAAGTRAGATRPGTGGADAGPAPVPCPLDTCSPAAGEAPPARRRDDARGRPAVR